MMETSSAFDKNNPIKSVSLGTSDSGDKEYVLERTSNDMGNILYFRMEGNYSNTEAPRNAYNTAIEYESIEVTFAPDGDFVPQMWLQQQLIQLAQVMWNHHTATDKD
jgi:hypothetical protein